MQYKKVLVTGADGFIGSHLVEHLVRQGYSVKAFVLYNSFNSWGWLDSLPPDVMKDVEVFTGDIRDPEGVRTAMAKCDAVLHLAALIAIPYSYHSPDTYVDTNIKGTLHVLQGGSCSGGWQGGPYFHQRGIWYSPVRAYYGRASVACPVSLFGNQGGGGSTGPVLLPLLRHSSGGHPPFLIPMGLGSRPGQSSPPSLPSLRQERAALNWVR